MHKKVMWTFTVALSLLPVLVVAVCYGALPDQVPINWGFDGTVAYGSRATLWLLALLSPALLALLRLVPKIDPRRRNYAKFQPYYDGFCLALMLFFLGLIAVTLSESLWPGRISVARVVCMGVGVLLVFVGNLMPKVKNNFFMGVRTPWTLSDPDVWNRANRLGGQCLFWYGLALMAGGLLLPEVACFVLLLVGAAVMIVAPTLMSYLWYQKKRTDSVDKGQSQ